MVNLAAMVWRRLLRKRWVLALVFGLSLVYFLTSTFKQVSGRPPSPGEGSCLCSRAARVSGAPGRLRRGGRSCPGAEDGRRDPPISLVGQGQSWDSNPVLWSLTLCLLSP